MAIAAIRVVSVAAVIALAALAEIVAQPSQVILRQAQDRLAAQVSITAHRIAVTAMQVAAKVKGSVDNAKNAAHPDSRVSRAAKNAASAQTIVGAW